MNTASPTLWRSLLKFIGILLLVAVIVLMVGTTAVKYIGLDTLMQAQQHVESWYWGLLVFRVSLYALFIANYDKVTRHFARRGNWSPEHLQRALQGRRFMAGNLVLLEAVISAPHWLSVVGL